MSNEIEIFQEHTEQVVIWMEVPMGIHYYLETDAKTSKERSMWPLIRSIKYSIT